MGSAARKFTPKGSQIEQTVTMDEAKEKFFQCHDDTKTAFEELCAMVDALNAEREEKRGAAMARFEAMKAWNAHLREKNQRLRAKYIAVVDMYNTLAEEVKERSDSSSSSEEEQDDNCCIM